MITDNYTQISLSFQGAKIVTINFNGGNITSDAGLLPIREYDEKINFTSKVAQLLIDKRTPYLVDHQLIELVRQRLYGIIAGYEDANDAQYLRIDPVFLAITKRDSSKPLATQPTISRFENKVLAKEVIRLNRFLLDHYIARAKRHKRGKERIIIDVDSTADPCHGAQQLSFFNGFYDQHMYHPLLFFDGASGDLLSVRLRPGNVHGSHRMTVDLRRVVEELRRRLHTKQIIFRSDAAGASPYVYRVAEDLGIDYLIGLPANRVLKRRVAWLVSRAKQAYKRTGKAVKYYTSFLYRAKSWHKKRRVLVKIEYNEKGLNCRFLVTSFRVGVGKGLFDLYEDRGESENWIKEFKNGLKADRLSCHGYIANAFRLLLYSLAYVFIANFRADVLKRTELARATIETIRLKLIKVGAVVKETVRRIWFQLSSGWPFRPIFIQVCKNLCFDTS